MAIKKQIDGNFYLYGVIVRMEYSKDRPMAVAFSIRKLDSSGQIYDIDTTHYSLPEVYEEFGIEALSEEGNNLYKAFYIWLKQHKPIFSDWVDC
jgi:hypothetical protein